MLKIGKLWKYNRNHDRANSLHLINVTPGKSEIQRASFEAGAEKVTTYRVAIICIILFNLC